VKARRSAGAALLLMAAACSWGAEPAPKSGFDYLTPETRLVQQDDFLNPGMLWVEKGRVQWSTPEASGKSCASCHDAGTPVAQAVARYPRYLAAVGHVINLEQQINRCRTEQLHVAAWGYESEALLAMTSFLAHLARGIRIEAMINGPAAASFERGREFFYRRRGQYNLACASCHEQHAGDRLHGEVISQGQTNGFPIYRQLWQALGSTHRMFAWCNEAIRAEPYPPGSQEYVDLELYERWRGRGLKIESPAVRR
jgi:L-cysteine S-thiosulfotransferase